MNEFLFVTPSYDVWKEQLIKTLKSINRHADMTDFFSQIDMSVKLNNITGYMLTPTGIFDDEVLIARKTEVKDLEDAQKVVDNLSETQC